MKLKKLPIGIQTFEKIIDGNYIYIDKTQLAYDLIENYEYVFLSRPRRFGKSLFLDTLHNIFEGKKELFQGLAIYDKWDWSESYPVIKIDWAGNFKTLISTKKVAKKVFEKNQKRLGIDCDFDIDEPGICFSNLIEKAYEKYQKPVVILIDEYDKPILDNMDNIKRANENRDFLRGIYIQLKANDAYIKFAFLTGITKFSKASIFSGLNQIEDISLTKRYGTICGYTQDNIENEFKDYLVGVDLKRLKSYYNGYNFLGQSVYNPFDILKFIKNDFMFKNYWWESGNAFSLIELLKKGDYFLPSLQNLTTDETLLNSFDLENLQLESLLFQAGYLTIDKVSEDDGFGFVEYSLKVPNLEVQISLNRLIISYLTSYVNVTKFKDIRVSLSNGNLEQFRNTLTSLFSSIAHDNFRNNNIAHFEGYWASLVYAYLAGCGVELIAEDVTNRGKIDLTVFIKNNIYIIEFKIDTNKEDALTQIKEKNYAQKYLNQNKNIYLVGIDFSEDDKNISGFEWERL
jgi:hypothetical protein